LNVIASYPSGCSLRLLRGGSAGTVGDMLADSAEQRHPLDTEKERRMQWDLQGWRDMKSDGGKDCSSKIMWPDFKFPPVNLWNAPPSPQMLNLYYNMWYDYWPELGE
jgi:hypothetical protein